MRLSPALVAQLSVWAGGNNSMIADPVAARH
jgi:hypothetical protein